MNCKKLSTLLIMFSSLLVLCACSFCGAETAQRSQCQVGSYVTLGSYPRTKFGEYVPIEWLVLENDGETALLISRYALDCQMYNTVQKATTWEQCTLRSWLNNEFYNCAFSEDEKWRVVKSDVGADRNPNYNTNPGSSTKDKVFLLSIAEAERYFVGNEARKCEATNYAIQQGAYSSNGAVWWWLRSPGSESDYAAYVYNSGFIDGYGSAVRNSYGAVRPCVRIQTGNYVTFGSYPQTESGTDDTPIEWIVLENDGKTALLISRYALDCQKYNTEQEETTWEQSTLRSWLNNEFYNRAFSEVERMSILECDVSADKNPACDTNPGNATKDKVFLLSIMEADTYFASDEARMCAATEYASRRGADTSASYVVDGKEACWWWLRSPGVRSDYAALLYAGGSVISYGSDVSDNSDAVRPCVRVQLYQPGNYVTLGTYPQTASGTDDTPIEWLVLENDGETALLISRYGLDCQPYNAEWEDTTWEQCTLRSWLNNEFYNRVFTKDEKQMILKSDKDNVFLLSFLEAGIGNKYFENYEARKCDATEYAIQQGASTYKQACWWWLRQSGTHNAAIVDCNGSIIDYDNFGAIAVRPCVRVQLSKMNRAILEFRSS